MQRATNARLSLQLGAILVLVALVSGAATAAGVNYAVRAAVKPFEFGRLEQTARRLASDLEAYVRDSRADLRALTESLPLDSIFSAALAGQPLPAQSVEPVVKAFMAELKSRPHYLQLRLIGRDGQELLRAERAAYGAPPRLVSDAELQHKGHRPYFSKSMRLQPGQLYVSSIDLNVEHGRIQVPHVEVLRLGTPIGSGSGEPLGIVVLNVDMGPKLNSLRTAGDRGGQTYLVKDNGDYVLHPDRSREFGTELGQQHRLQQDFPAEFELALRGKRAAQRELRDASGNRLASAVPVTLASGPGLLLIATSPSVAPVAAWGAVRAIAWSAVGGAVGAVLLGAVLVRAVTRPLEQMTVAVNQLPSNEELAWPTAAPGELGILARAFQRVHRVAREQRLHLERQQQLFRTVVEAAPNGTVVVKDGKIALVNQALETLLGYTRQELDGQPLALLVPERAREGHAQHMQNYERSPRARAMGAGLSLSIRRKDGSEVAVEIGLNPLDLLEGRATLCSILDVTERKRHADELLRSNAELEQFAYVASHDLREPLRVVANFAELLAQRYQGRLDAQADKYIHYMIDGARRMQRLIRDLLEYSRVGSEGHRLLPVPAAEVVDDVVKTLAGPLQEAHGQVDVGALPTVLADREQLAQIFQNLIGNAIKFRSEAPPNVRIQAEARPGEWLFSVADNGIGIDMKYADRVFQMFQRLHARDRYDGSGIGLAIVKRIVERHGGHVWVESNPGAGSRFLFTLREAA